MRSLARPQPEHCLSASLRSCSCRKCGSLSRSSSRRRRRPVAAGRDSSWLWLERRSRCAGGFEVEQMLLTLSLNDLLAFAGRRSSASGRSVPRARPGAWLAALRTRRPSHPSTRLQFGRLLESRQQELVALGKIVGKSVSVIHNAHCSSDSCHDVKDHVAKKLTDSTVPSPPAPVSQVQATQQLIELAASRARRLGHLQWPPAIERRRPPVACTKCKSRPDPRTRS